jgi:small-conductance mechanosensitive channel
LRLLTHRLIAISRRSLPTGMRAQQLRTVAEVINSVGTAVIVFFVAVQVLDDVHLNIGPLLASAGIAGLAIGFGAQTLVKDVINGFFILVENQYDLGDTVRISGVKGTVETMTLRRTVLRDQDGSVHIVPNSEIKIVSNLTRDWTQVTLHVAVAYNEPSDRVIQLLQQVGQELRNDAAYADAIVADPEVPGIERVSSGEVDYLMVVKTKPADQYRVSRELRRRIKEAFEKNKIQPARPTHVYVVDPGTTGAPKPDTDS